MTVATAEDRAEMRRRARRHAIIVTAAVLGIIALGLIYGELTNRAEYEATLVVSPSGAATLTVQQHGWRSSKTVLSAQLRAPPGTPAGTFKRRSTDPAGMNSPIVETARDPTPPPMWKIRVFDRELMIMTTAVRVDGKHLTYGETPLQLELTGVK
jgi:hypothetical protein